MKTDTLTIRTSREEKKLIQEVAKLNGVSASKLIKSKIMEILEDEYDSALYDELMSDPNIKKESISQEEMMKELGINVSK